jgi:hypothetical protein
MRSWYVVAMVFVLLCANAQADVFNLGPGLANLETVTVGNPGILANFQVPEQVYTVQIDCVER